MGRIEPMGHERSFWMLEQTARLRDGKTRRVARQDRLRCRDSLQSRQQRLFDRQVFRNRFRHELHIGNSLGFRVGQEKASKRGFDLLATRSNQRRRRPPGSRGHARSTSSGCLPTRRNKRPRSRPRQTSGQCHGPSSPDPRIGDSANAVDLFHGFDRPVISRFTITHPHSPREQSHQYRSTPQRRRVAWPRKPARAHRRYRQASRRGCPSHPSSRPRRRS